MSFEISHARIVYRPHVILGPPGCGKTYTLLDHLEEELARGTSPERISFVTFTKPARKEAQDRVWKRFALGADQMPWLRTIHSTAYRLLQTDRRRILSDERWAEFGGRHGYDLTCVPTGFEDPDAAPSPSPRRTQADLARYVWGWGRSRGVDPEAALARCPVEGLSAGFYRLFVRRLLHFKQLECLLDFNDLLEGVLRGGLRPDVDVSFIDEAQDLSPLQIKVCELWFAPCTRSYVAGDDDQAIYGFQGADPSWLLELAKRREPKILSQSRRVPAAVHQLAERIIGQNQERVPKHYEPTPDDGALLTLDLGDALDLIEKHDRTFVLARNRMHLGRVARVLVDRGVPYLVEGDGAPSPLSNSRLMRGVEAAEALVKGKGISAKSLHALFGYIPSDRVVPRAAREQVERLAELGRPLTAEELGDLSLDPLTELIRRKGLLAPMTAVPSRIRRYVEGVLQQHGMEYEPRVRLTSMHGAKGREAELVILLPDMTRATFNGYGRRRKTSDYEAENRVFYVAVTRAIKTVVIVRPRGRRHYAFPSLRGQA